MGLRQEFKFKYEEINDVFNFLRSFNDNYAVEEKGNFFIIREKNGESFTFDAAIETTGLVSDRAGNYFEFLGKFVEQLTGEFGLIEIEDL